VARRRFAAGSILYCYFEIYREPGSSAGAGTAFEIVDRHGKMRQRGALPPPVRRDGGGMARLIEIPLTRIGPGEYELVLDLAGEVAGGRCCRGHDIDVRVPVPGAKVRVREGYLRREPLP